MKYWLFFLCLICGSYAYSLEIDEKLTLRFLKVSSTKKTALINRGAEDGLAVGDHAKFFITTGVVARGVVEKVSPSRSIWSFYRVIESDEIVEGKVLNLKIASPVKVTEDPSKSLKDEEVPAGSEKMSLGEGESEEKKESKGINDEDARELEEMGIPSDKKTPKKVPSKSSSNEAIPVEVQSDEKLTRAWEVWGTMNLSSLNGSYDDASLVASTEVISKNISYAIGLEKYFFDSDGLFKEVSLGIFVQSRFSESGLATKSQIKTSSSWFEYGANLKYHFYNSASEYNTPIGFAEASIGAGSAKIVDKGTPLNNSETTSNAKNNIFSVGVGAKYNLRNNFGAKAILDYFSSAETLDVSSVSVSRSMSGPRFQLGLSYRF